MTSTAIVFESPAPTTLSRRRGRPEKFTPEIQAALAARPGEFAVIQTGIKSMSRVSVLKAKYGESFEFVGEKDGKGGVKVFARALVTADAEAEAEAEATPEPVAEAEPEAKPAAAKRVRPSRAKAAQAK